jgi:hypothetical protein
VEKRKALLEAFRAFFDYQEQEEIATIDVVKKTSFLAAGRIFYAASDYVIAAGLGTFVFWMEARNTASVNIYLGTALYDFIAASIYFYLSDMTGCDFTLGQSFRRVADSFKKSGFWGTAIAWILLLGVSVKAIIWEGPEVICFLFKKELGSKTKAWIALFLLSALQGIFGAWLYTTGYALWEKLGSESLVKSNYAILGVITFVFVVVIVSLAKRITQWVMSAIRFLLKKMQW